MLQACREVAEGKFDDEFPIDVFQTGSGTSSNMNCNEVIANRAIEICGGDRFQAEKPIHPNDHVNMGQSTNDIFPTRSTWPSAVRIKTDLIPALATLRTMCWPTRPRSGTRSSRSAARTWPTPRRCGWARRSAALPGSCSYRCNAPSRRSSAILELPAGGTAVGTGINTHPEFGRRVAEVLAKETGIPFVEAVNHFEANAQRDGLVECHGQLRTIAVDAVQRRQQHPLARLRSALRLLRSAASRSAARQLDHARQGEPRDVREHDAGRRARDRQRQTIGDQRRDRRASSSSTS